jgi:hypothetical protein
MSAMVGWGEGDECGTFVVAVMAGSVFEFVPDPGDLAYRVIAV